MADGIKIEFDQDDIDGKDDSEKLTLLLKIAFANHTTLQNHSKILFGNGQQGICDQVRENCKGLKAMWAIVLLIVAGFITMALK